METTEAQGMTTRYKATIKVENAPARVSWNKENIEYFLDTIIKFIEAGEVFTDKNFKSQDWTKIMNEFNKSSFQSYDKMQLQNCYSELKRKYTTYHALRQQSGFGFDEVNIHVIYVLCIS